MLKNKGPQLRKTGIALAAFACAAFAPAVFAAPLNLSDGDTIKIDRSGGAVGGAFGGGEFRATGMSVLNGSSGSFLTFCVEFPEHIALGGVYYVDVDTKAQNGGAGVSGYGGYDVNGVAGSYDPLSKGTAWLYTQFSNNTLDTAHGVAYNFAPTAANGNSLQLAIWNLEDELTGSATNSSSTLYAFNHDAVAQNWASVAKTQGALWSDVGRVRILNLYDTRSGTPGNYTFSGNHQDQLYIVPIPEPETYAMLLAGLGLLGFAARRRKLKEGVAA